MKSAKIVNKILLISLALGSLSIVAGMIAGGNLKKALLGVGATTSIASVAGMIATNGNKESAQDQEERQLNSNQVTSCQNYQLRSWWHY